MAKEMSHEVTDEITENLVSEVHAAKKLVTLAMGARVMQHDVAPPQSGVASIGNGSLAERKHVGALPALPCPPVRKRPKVVAELEANEPKTEVRMSDQVLSYRSGTMDSQARSNQPPTVSPRLKNTPRDVVVPKPPKVPTGIEGSNQPLQPVKPPHSVIPKLAEVEEMTRVCPAAVIQNLLSKDKGVESLRMQPAEDEATRVGKITIEELAAAERQLSNSNQSSADEVTRVGKITIEELAAAERKLSKSTVGHEDVTRTYSFDVSDPPSQITAPGKHQLQAELHSEPRVIIQDLPTKRKFRWRFTATLAVSACVAVLGWDYRSSIERSLRGWENSFMRGIGSATNHQPVQQDRAPAIATIALSISVSPADAVLTVDGARVSNPFSIEGRPDPLSHEIRAVAPGYVPLRRQVQFDRDLTMVLSLSPIVTTTEEQRATVTPRSAAIAQTRVVTAKPTSKTKASNGSAQQNCSPPFVVDAAGIKTFRPECL
jgi:hypothetical protein